MSDTGRAAWLPSVEEIDAMSPRDALAWERHKSSARVALRASCAQRHRDDAKMLASLDAPFRGLRAELEAKKATPGGAEAPRSSEHAAACGRVAAAVGGCSGERSELLAGLVPFKTTQTRPIERFEIDRISARIHRLRKAVGNSAHMLDADAHMSGSFRWRRLFVTLTYADGADWRPLHLSQFVDCVRKWFKRNGGMRMRLAWVLELQKRGAVHYHCIIWVPAHKLMPRPDQQGWWRWGSSGIDTVAGGINRPVAYLAKYTSKVGVDQCNRVPKGARMHGCNGLTEEGKRIVRYWRSPVFARDALGAGADIRKCQGGYVDKLTGEYLASPWKVTITPAGRVFAWRHLDVQIPMGVAA